MQQHAAKSDVEQENERLRRQVVELEAQLGRLHGNPNVKPDANIPAVIYRVELNADHQMRFAYVSDGCEAVYGLTPEQILSDIHAVREMIHPDDRPHFYDCLKDSLDSLERFTCEYQIVNARGETKWIRATSSPSRSADQTVTWNGVLSDITDSKVAEINLRHQVDDSKQEIRQISALVDAGIALTASCSLVDALNVVAEQARILTHSGIALTVLTDDDRWDSAVRGLSLSPKHAAHEADVWSANSDLFRKVVDDCNSLRLSAAKVEATDPKDYGRRYPADQACVAVPLLDRDGHALGLLYVADPDDGKRDYEHRDELCLRQYARMASLELELRKAHEELEDRVKQRTADLAEEERVLRRLIELQERERKQISHDIHDGFIQYVVAAQMFLETMGIRMAKADETRPPELDQIRELVDQALTEGRRMIAELRPTLLDDCGIVEALERLVGEEQRKGLTVRLRVAMKHLELDSNLEQAVFRIVQEGLTNVRRHAQASRADVRLTESRGMLRIIVRDRGIGFAPQEIGINCFGLRGITERAKLFSGRANVHSRPGHGTILFVEIPVVTPRSS